MAQERGGVVKKYDVAFEWTLDTLPQTNRVTVWAGSEASALNIASTELRAFATSFSVSWRIVTMSVSVL